MSPLARIRQVAACTLVLSVSLSVQAADPAAPPAAAQSPSPVQLAPNIAREIARSALLSVEATATADALQLRIRRLSDRSPVSGAGVTVTVDGKSAAVSRLTDGYEVPIEDLRGESGKDGGRDVEVVVPHDGIREILAGKILLANGHAAGNILGDHRQIVWWIVNIVVVLIAAMAISRRKG